MQRRLLLHRWRGWIWNTSMWIYWHTHSSSSCPSSTSSSSSASSSLSLHSWALTKYQKAQRESINKAKVLDPFYKIKKEKKEKQSSEEISIPTLIPARVNFWCRQPLRPVKSNVTPGEGERNIQIIFQIFFQRCLSELLLSSLTALTINLCLTDYSSNQCWPQGTCTSTQTQPGNWCARISVSTCQGGRDTSPPSVNHS